MGFDPTDVDSPRIEPSPSSKREIRDFVEWMKGRELVWGDPEQRQDVWRAWTKYFSCIHINECILEDWDYTIHEILLKVRGVLNTCMTAYNSYLKSRLKKGLRPPAGKEQDIEWSLPSLQKLMKRILDKLIDPCIMHKYVEGPEADWINTSCILSCQFLSSSLQVFKKTVFGCGELKSGTCNKNGVCICSQWIVSTKFQSFQKQVNMASCHNAVRKSIQN
ncbi:uncharacterized protein [Bemisia tabaci]|uniref:uncharacterized protein n=1 Tax=Bemisia tabaci TaxID=7038 RepID=UPI003B2841EA